MEHLILLHGAIGSSDQLKPFADVLKKDFHIHTLNFTGHGGQAFSEKPFSIDLFAQDVLKFMDEQSIESANLFGYSMGGYVGIYLAKYFPEKVKKVITLATKFYWDEPTAAKEVQMLDAEKLEIKVPAFAAALKDRHEPNDWKQVLSNTSSMLLSLGRNNDLVTEAYKDIIAPCLLVLGDRDKMITLGETVDVFKTLPNAQMAMLPGTPHPIEQVNAEVLCFLIRKFLDT